MRTTFIAAVVVACGCAVAPARAEPGRLADFTLGVKSPAPGAPTGLGFHAAFHAAGDPDAKPSPIRTAVIEIPPGLRYDSTALPQCTASDEAIRLLGSAACPADSELTVGKLTAITGFGAPVDPLGGDDHVFNGPDQIIEIITAPGTPLSPGFDRLTITGSTITAHPPATPGGPPDGETAITSIDFDIPVRAAGGKALITTPTTCPESGRWTATGKFGFADGSSDTVVSASPCAGTATPHRAPVTATPASSTMRLSVQPRRVRSGRRARLNFHVRSSDPRCVTGARVRVAGRAVRTDGRGRATLTAALRRGERRVTVTSPGCGAATAIVRVS